MQHLIKSVCYHLWEPFDKIDSKLQNYALCQCLRNVIFILGHDGKIAPKKGAAAFWYDILSAGFRDLHSVHAGCPVLKGSKWILNKWLFMLDNFKKFPCKLSQLARFSPPSKEHYF